MRRVLAGLPRPYLVRAGLPRPYLLATAILALALTGSVGAWAYSHAQPVQAQTAVTGAIVKKWTILENMDNTSGYTMSMEVLLGGLPQPTALTVDVALPFGENPSQLNQRISDAIVAQATRFGFSLSRTSVIIPSFTKGQ